MERAMHALHLNGSVPALAGRRSNFKAGSCTAVAPRPHAGGANTGRQSSFVVRCMADAQAEGEASSSAAVPKKKGFGKASSATVAPDKLCPCGSSKLYEDCCMLIHKGAVADSPEAVVRARFSAYVKAEGEYLVTSTHPSSPDAQRGAKEEDHIPQLRKDLLNTMKNLKFLKLTIVRSDDGGSADEAFVTFRASYVERKAKGGDGKSLQMGTLWKEAAVNRTLSQKSRFVRDGGAGAWRYVSSVDLSPNTVGKY